MRGSGIDDTQSLLLGVGETIDGAYRIRGVLGYGGMGEVYEAEELLLGRSVALKVAGEPRAALLLRHEAQALAAVRHRGLPEVLRLGAHRGLRYLALERLRGITLEEHLATRGALGLDEAIAIGADLADVLAAVHAAGMAHRDLKPANVMMCDDGRTALLDFGIAMAAVETARADLRCGTPRYVAPESIRGDLAPARLHLVDVYALGAVLHELLDGRPPFDSPSVVEILEQHLALPPPDLEPRGVPRPLAALIRACLAKDPGERPADMQAIGWELGAISRRVAAGTPPGGALPLGREPRLAGRMTALRR